MNMVICGHGISNDNEAMGEDLSQVGGSVVDVESPRPIVFLHQKDRRRECRGARANDALLQHPSTLVLKL
jgi:hypothetical protein